MALEHLYWPPAALLSEAATQNERVDLLSYLDAEVYNTRGSYPLKLGVVTVLRDRVVLEGFSSRSRDTQTALASQFQASFAEQGYHVVVKEWASESQRRAVLRIRLKCRFAGCKYHMQINFDSNMGYWFLSRRRCGVFQHSCRAAESANTQATTQEYVVAPPTRSKRPSVDSPTNLCAPVAAKRTRFDPHEEEQRKLQEPYLVTPRVNSNQHALSVRTVSCEQSPAAQVAKTKPIVKNETSVMEDFAESLLELSKGKAGKEGSSPKQDDKEKEAKESGKNSEETEETAKKPEKDPSAPQAEATVSNAPNGGVVRPGVQTRSVVLGEIPYASQAFQQMAATMGPNLFNHVVHARGEVTLQMTFDGEGFVLRTNVPMAPPSLPHPPPSVPPPPHHPPQQQQQHRGSISSDSSAGTGVGRVALPNYPYLPQRRFPAHARNDPNVVML